MNTKVFSVLFLAVFSATLGVGLIIPILPVYAHELGATGLYIGLILGVFSLSRTIFLPYFGKLSDLKGRKPFITYGLLLYSMISILYILSKSVHMLILTRLLHGFAAAMVLPVAMAYAGEFTPKYKEGFIMSLFNLSLYAGQSAGPIAGGIAKDHFGFEAPFLGMGLISLFGFLLCLILLPPRKHERLLMHTKTPIRYRILIMNKYVGALFTFRLAFTICLGMVWVFLPILADTKFKLSGSAIGVLIMTGILTSTILQVPMGLVADRASKRTLITLGGLITAIAIFSYTHAQGFWGLFLATTLFGVGGGVSMPAVMAMSVIIGRKTDSMGSIMGLLTMGHSLGMLVGPVLGGLMMDIFQLSITFVGGTAVMVLGVIVALLLTSGFQTWAKD